jgi:hypothetical protein
MINDIRENPGITKEIEPILLDIITANPNDSFTDKNLEPLVKNKISDKYKGVDILSHISLALDMLHSNKFVKRIGPGIWQSVDGPDPVYSDRSTGYSPEGEFARRGKNFLGSMGTSERKKFNQDVSGAEVSVKMLKSAGLSEKQIFDSLTKTSATKFNPVAIKVAIRKVFALPGTPGTGDGEEVDPSIFGIDFEK